MAWAIKHVGGIKGEEPERNLLVPGRVALYAGERVVEVVERMNWVPLSNCPVETVVLSNAIGSGLVASGIGW